MGDVSFAEVFARIESRSLAPDEVRAAFGAILTGAWTPVQIGAFAAALRMRGESAETIVAAAEALRAVMTPVDHDLVDVVDTCGTGGDGAHTLNVSTAAAIVVAAAGCFVAKHGNRSVSSRCGSADVVDALGIPIDIDPARQRDVLRDARIAFLMLLRLTFTVSKSSSRRKAMRSSRFIFSGMVSGPSRRAGSWAFESFSSSLGGRDEPNRFSKIAMAKVTKSFAVL